VEIITERERSLNFSCFLFFLRIPFGQPKNCLFYAKDPIPRFLGHWRPDPMRQRLAIFFSLLLVTAAFSRLGQTPLAAPRTKSVAMAITVWTTEDAEDKVL
jgi:hypothetical protein